MPLGADATVCYAYELPHAECTPRFIAAHITLDTPYNTRRKLGLPPTPIASFSRETFLAVVFAENSQYYYYLHDASGVIHYARTLDEHNANKRQYLAR